MRGDQHYLLCDAVGGYQRTVRNKIDKTFIIQSLQQDGISEPAKFKKLGLKQRGDTVAFESHYALLLGTDRQSRQRIGADLFLADADWFTLLVPRPKEWLAADHSGGSSFNASRRGSRGCCAR
jgi:hypothetical protein